MIERWGNFSPNKIVKEMSKEIRFGFGAHGPHHGVDLVWDVEGEETILWWMGVDW